MIFFSTCLCWSVANTWGRFKRLIFKLTVLADWNSILVGGRWRNGSKMIKRLFFMTLWTHDLLWWSLDSSSDEDSDLWLPASFSTSRARSLYHISSLQFKGPSTARGQYVYIYFSVVSFKFRTLFKTKSVWNRLRLALAMASATFDITHNIT